jgi:hypothetical protein
MGHAPTSCVSEAPHSRCQAQSSTGPPCSVQIPLENLKIPIFQGHGDSDPLIPPFIGAGTQEVLEGLGKPASRQSLQYPLCSCRWGPAMDSAVPWRC